MDLFGKENVANDGTNDDSDSDEADGEDNEVFEVEKILAICNSESYFKVRRKDNKADEDSCQPIKGLGSCKYKTIKDFVTKDYKSKILPLPSDVDVICGEPRQDISVFNRFRNKDNPLEDKKNKQLIVYIDLLQYLKPRLYFNRKCGQHYLSLQMVFLDITHWVVSLA